MHAEAEFLTPACLYDTLEIRTSVARVGRTSLHLRHEVVRLEDGVVLARGSAVRVYIRRDASRALRGDLGLSRPAVDRRLDELIRDGLVIAVYRSRRSTWLQLADGAIAQENRRRAGR